MQISISTKQHIFDELKSRKINPSGKIDEAEFIRRLIDLAKLPTNDPRYEDMAGDFYQHRVNNPTDWDDYWLFTDERVNLLNNDDIFKLFIVELLHPAVHEAKEAQILKDVINYYLKKDGYQIVEDEAYYEPGVSTYKFVEINPTQIEKGFKTLDEFVHEAYEKIDKRLRDEDYSGAVSSARTLLEYAIKDIYYQITGDTIDKIDDLQEGFKKIQKLLKLDYEKTADENQKKILRSIVTIVNSLAPLFNNLGDRHASKSTARRNSALFCTDSTKIFVNFLYGRMQDLHGLYPSLYDRIIKELDSDLRSQSKATIIAYNGISNVVSLCDEYITGILINKHIEEANINSFRESDIFFAFLSIFSSSITERQLISALQKHKNNDQAIGWKLFLKDLYSERKELFTKKVFNLISEYSNLSGLVFE